VGLLGRDTYASHAVDAKQLRETDGMCFEANCDSNSLMAKSDTLAPAPSSML